MRTTLTLDRDVAEALRDAARRSRRSFKQVVNETLRAGLAAQAAPRPSRYRVRPVSLGGVVTGIDLDRVLALSDQIEDLEIARKLQVRK